MNRSARGGSVDQISAFSFRRIWVVGEVPFSDRLRDVHLSSVFYLLQRQQRAGILRVCLNDLEKWVYIREGEILFATSRYPDDRLGLLLLKTGKLSDARYETAVQIYEEALKRKPENPAVKEHLSRLRAKV